MVRGGQRASGQLDIRGTFIGHWRTGVWLDAGSRVDLESSRIFKSALGVLMDEAEGTVRDSAIGASEATTTYCRPSRADRKVIGRVAEEPGRSASNRSLPVSLSNARKA